LLLKEYLATLDDAAFGAASDVIPKFVSPSDPAAQWTGAIDKSKREDGTFSREDFTFYKEGNVYVCPAFKTFTTTGKIMHDDMLFYRASTRDCAACVFKARCCPKEPSRKLLRSIYEEAREVSG
jgi:hypothetical protein